MKISPAEEDTGPLPPAMDGGVDEPRRRVSVVGNPESQWKAQYLIFEKLREEGFSSGMEDVKLTVEITVPSAQVRAWYGSQIYFIIPQFNSIASPVRPIWVLAR